MSNVLNNSNEAHHMPRWGCHMSIIHGVMIPQVLLHC